jgi:hypothetical protein
MTPRRRLAIWITPILAVAVLVAAILMYVRIRAVRRRPILLMGIVLVQDADPRKQLPIADTQVSLGDGLALGEARSAMSGVFTLPLKREIKAGTLITLRLRHSDYQPLELKEVVSDKIIVARMAPLRRETPAKSSGPETVVANVLVRYSVKAITASNIGSAVKTFEVVNTGNVPCNNQFPCSPGGKWKAAIGSTMLDAGEGNEFRNARVSCIAGPCPFTQVVSDDFSRGGRTISVSVRNWSDTATYLIEAEVVHPMVSDISRDSYPVIYDRGLNFNLPGAAEGPSIQAEINGETVVFPLGPSLCLSWANCNVGVDKDQTKAYRCELKPGYRFR